MAVYPIWESSAYQKTHFNPLKNPEPSNNKGVQGVQAFLRAIFDLDRLKLLPRATVQFVQLSIVKF
jgi:hypothetical protein